MEKRAYFSPPAVGGSSLLVIFALLALCVFAVLSLTTAQTEARLSKVSAQAVADYYAADLQAEKQFSQLKKEVTEPGEYHYDCPVSENRQLQVSLRFDGKTWQVIRWQMQVAEEPEVQKHLPVWDGKEDSYD